MSPGLTDTTTPVAPNGGGDPKFNNAKQVMTTIIPSVRVRASRVDAAPPSDAPRSRSRSGNRRVAKVVPMDASRGRHIVLRLPPDRRNQVGYVATVRGRRVIYPAVSRLTLA